MGIPLRKFVAPEFVYGSGARTLAGQFAANVGARRLFIVSGPDIVIQPWFQSILDPLAEEGLDHTLFTEVSVNPRDHECAAGAKAYQESGSDMILAIGGGSVLDCAKGIGILTANAGPISRYEGVDEICYPIPPLICIPTTAGSAADISQFAIITNSEQGYKMALVSKTLVPDLSLTDPDVTLTVDLKTSVDTGLDVLAHAVESYVSNASSPFTRIHSREAVRLVLCHLPEVFRNPEDLEARDGMMKASLFAGLAFSNASLGMIHAIAHALGGRFDLIHGALNGILMAAVAEHNHPWAEEAYADLCGLFEAAGYLPDTIGGHLRTFSGAFGPPQGLRSLGVSREAFSDLIPIILKDPCNATNPAPVTKEGLMRIYEQLQ